MAEANELKFTSPSFAKRLRGMLGVDFYRLFHTPMYYIFLAIAAIIPALVSMGGGEGGSMYTTMWNIIAADTPLYIINTMGDYANMNMVFMFGGIMVSIFIGHDYRSGYVKQLFTTHAKKQDYMISKTLVSAFSMGCMCITYLIGGTISGMISGLSAQVNAGSLLLAVLGKMIMSLGWASLYTFLNVVFRRYFGISIASCFILGTGIPIIGAAAILGNNTILNIFLYGSSAFACLTANLTTLLTCIVVSLAWTVIYNLFGTILLKNCDVY